MKEAFELFLVKACLAGLGAIALYVLANIAIPTALEQLKGAAQRAGRKGIFLLAVPLSFAGVMIGHGSEKSGAPEGEHSSPVRSEVQHRTVRASRTGALPDVPAVQSCSRGASSTMSSDPRRMTRIERWFRRGAGDRIRIS